MLAPRVLPLQIVTETLNGICQSVSLVFGSLKPERVSTCLTRVPSRSNPRAADSRPFRRVLRKRETGKRQKNDTAIDFRG